MRTINGIYNDINESEYVVRFRDYDFYFSSQVYAKKFQERINDYIKEESKKLELKYKSEIDSDILLMFTLYKLIEKRGFKVVCDSGRILENIPLFKVEVSI